ncbi:TIGR00341 family protein [Sphingomonadales bacterium EhC05]|jgi:uncharacterized hydrophobic protein (TIGR00271 family)|uniref:TIGR00341 family protein n=1 Tax=Parasphingorhabdus sp. TaxID=2709688 RepID=UPI0007F444AE|nr:TIGR00341 family protein [Sphingomonadales bacterium EhC05]
MVEKPDRIESQQKLQAKRDSGMFSPISGSIKLLRRWWRTAVQAEIDQQAVIEKIKTDCSFTPRYAFLTCMSAGIAILGLLLSSPAVVIGAMLLSPLMYPIMGVGFALAIGDSHWLKDAGKALLLGTIIAISFSAFVVLMSPLQTVTPEIASRTRPNLFDLAVALFSGLAGAYAMIRGGMGTIVGVAIATALMPPLAVVGFGLATNNWAVFGGSLLLYFTNFMTIALTATVMAWLYGFRSYLSERQTQFQIFVMVVVFVGLAIPLGISLVQIGREANISRSANGYIKDEFGPRARVSQIDIDFNAEPILVTASVFTPTIKTGAEDQSSRFLSRTFNQAISVKIEQYRVETGNDAAKAELASKRLSEQQEAVETQVSDLRDRLALVAGVSGDDVIIDTAKRRAVVMAKPLPGASLSTFFVLEQRISSEMQDWAISIQPPAIALPAVRVLDGKIDEESVRQLELVIWAAHRSPLGLQMAGADPDFGIVARALAAANIFAVRATDLPAEPGTLEFQWRGPDNRETADD